MLEAPNSSNTTPESSNKAHESIGSLPNPQVSPGPYVILFFIRFFLSHPKPRSLRQTNLDFIEQFGFRQTNLDLGGFGEQFEFFKCGIERSLRAESIFDGFGPFRRNCSDLRPYVFY